MDKPNDQDQAMDQNKDDGFVRPNYEQNPRNSHINDLYKRVQQERVDQGDSAKVPEDEAPAIEAEKPNHDIDADDTETGIKDAPAPIAEDDSVETPSLTMPKPAEPQKPTVEMVSMVVDGNEVQVPRSVKESYERAMAQVSHMKDDPANEPKHDLDGDLQSRQDKAQEDFDQRLTEIVDKIQFGEAEDGKAALKEFADLIKANQKSEAPAMPHFDPKAFAEQVEQRLTEKTEWQNAVKHVESKYSDVMSDPVLKREFRHREEAAREAGDKRSYQDLYVSIAKDLQEYKQSLAPSKVDPKAVVKESLTERNALKEVTTPPPGGQTVTSKEPTTPKPQSTTDIIAAMRSVRGQS